MISTQVEESVFHDMRNKIRAQSSATGAEYSSPPLVNTPLYTPARLQVFFGTLNGRKLQPVYLSRSTCATEYSSEENVAIKSMTIPVPNSVDLMKNVYYYILHKEFEQVVKDNCYGCDNYVGRAGDVALLISLYGKKSHDTITKYRLLAAVDIMCKEFGIENHQCLDDIERFLQNVYCYSYLEVEKSLVFEFNKIDKVRNVNVVKHMLLIKLLQKCICFYLILLSTWINVGFHAEYN